MAGAGPVPGGQLSTRTRDRLGRALNASAGTSTWLAAGLITLGAGCGWLFTYRAGGTPSVFVHVFYLPIVFAASRFQWRGAIVTAVVAGLLAGPLMPLDASRGELPATDWLGRLVAFLAIGILVAWLSGESSRSVAMLVRDTRGARELRQGLDRGEFEAHYQPIVDLGTGCLVGFEALCRWQDPVRGTVPPSDFIPLAERTGVIVALGTFMLERAITQAAAWRAAGGAQLVIAVNVSASQLCQAEFVTHVSATLTSSGLRPQSLCLEITETEIIRDRETARSHIGQLHGMGVLIALDDFGTGQSSLAYLQTFPIDIIKIDQSFVRTLDLDPKSAALVAAIVSLAGALGASTIGEGIERRAQLDALRELGCSQGQGYLLGRPGPAYDPSATEWLNPAATEVQSTPIPI